MFTGIIEETGFVGAILHGHHSSKITIRGNIIFDDLKLGDSVAVNGVCLTVCKIEGNTFTADIMNETLSRTNLGKLKSGDRLNLERAMPMNGRFGGHIVSGHIDGTGTIVEKTQDDIAVILTINTTKPIIHYIVEKGSITIDGISLTVVKENLDKEFFQVSIIPHTASNTTLLDKRIGDTVNLENDIVSKYVERFTLSGFENNTQHYNPNRQKKSTLTKDFLLENGF